MRIFSFLNFFGKNLDNKPPIKFTKFDELIEIHKKYNFKNDVFLKVGDSKFYS